jgi:hypothetical protein
MKEGGKVDFQNVMNTKSSSENGQCPKYCEPFNQYTDDGFENIVMS